MEVQREIMFGCSLESITTQLGLNQNPTTYSIAVVQDQGQAFSLAGLPKHGIRRPARITLGALDMYGMVLAWDQQEIDPAGTGIFNVRVADMRVAMDAVQVVLEAPLNVDLGTNVVAVEPETSEDLNSGLKYTRIRSVVEKKVFRFGDAQFKVDLSEIKVTDRVIDIPGIAGDREKVPYRVRGSAMSLVELIQTVADDHGLDWYVETSRDSQGILHVTVKTVDRSYSELTMQALANRHPGAIMRLNRGHEGRDDITRTVLLGAQKQYLSQEPAINWKPFWGFTEDGEVLTEPKFKLTDPDGSYRWRVTSYAEMEQALNGEITAIDPSEGSNQADLPIGAITGTIGQPAITGTKPACLPEDELNALRSYTEEFWGKQFYAEIKRSQIDDDGEPWIDVSSAGWWDKSTTPDLIASGHKMTLCTDDGRWVAFARLKSPSTIGVVWDASVSASRELLASGKDKYHMKCSIQRVDLLRNDDDDTVLPSSYKRRKGSIFLLTLPVALTVTAKVRRDTNGNVISTPGFWVNRTTQGETRLSRLNALGDVFVPILDRRATYGPWSSDSFIPKAFQHDGKTRVTVDTSLAPWTFAWRGIKKRDADRILEAVATARLKASTIQFMEVDTGELEVAGLPAVNLGTAIGYGTNITSINCSYNTKGLRTLYKCNVYTGELARHQRYYQELVDKLRRDAQRRQNTQYPLANYWTTNKELSAMKQGLTSSSDGSGGGGAYGELSYRAKVVSREDDGPCYMVNKLKEVLVDGYLTLESASVFDTKATNMAENPGAPARVPIGTIVTIRPWKTVKLPSTNGKPTIFVEAWVMDETPPTPMSLTMRTTSAATNNGDGPRYPVELIEGTLDGLCKRDTDQQSYQRIRNLGEPASSPGHLPIGTQVTVNWVLNQNTQLYVPSFNSALNIFVTPEEV